MFWCWITDFMSSLLRFFCGDLVSEGSVRDFSSNLSVGILDFHVNDLMLWMWQLAKCFVVGGDSWCPVLSILLTNQFVALASQSGVAYFAVCQRVSSVSFLFSRACGWSIDVVSVWAFSKSFVAMPVATFVLVGSQQMFVGSDINNV